MFSDKYDKLYNSVPHDVDLFQKNKDKIDQWVLNKNYCEYYWLKDSLQIMSQHGKFYPNSFISVTIF